MGGAHDRNALGAAPPDPIVAGLAGARAVDRSWAVPMTAIPANTLVDIDHFVAPRHGERAGLPRTLIGWLTTTDHKAIGIAYAVTALVFLAIGGALAGIIRAELAEPGLQLVSEQAYNSVFTIHGSVMVYLFAVPFGFALANYLVPLQIGAPDLAFPRLNALSYWLYLFGGVTMLLGFLTDGGAAAFGWFAYP